MLRGYRGILIAAFGCLACPSEGQVAQSNQQQASNAIEAKLDRIGSAVEKLPGASTPDHGCQTGQDDRHSDLCAQWKAADAAAESADWTARTFWAGLAGLLVGAGTLFFAARAAHWAKEAARHTESGAVEASRGANAAEEAVEQSRDASQTDLRAWVTIKLDLVSCRRNPDFAGITVEVALENLGRTPAFGVTASVKGYVVPSVIVEGGELASLDRPGHSLSPLMPGAQLEQNIRIQILTEDILKGVAEARSAGFEPIIIIDGVVFYRTVFDSEDAPKRVTSIRYVMSHTIQQGPDFRGARMAWLDTIGPAEKAQVRFSQEKGARVYLT